MPEVMYNRPKIIGALVGIGLTLFAGASLNHGAYRGVKQLIEEGNSKKEIRYMIDQFRDEGNLFDKAMLNVARPGIELALLTHDE